MARPARLNRTLIVDSAAQLLAEDGALSMARLGERLAADPSAVYRWFDGKDELLRAVGDRMLDGVLDGLPSTGDWRATVGELCHRLRSAHLRHPDLSVLIRDRPPLQANEVALTDAMLGALRSGGFDPQSAVEAYHALIELTIGSAVLDSAIAALDAERREVEYVSWRASYAALDDATHPHATELADLLYRGSSDDRFAAALSRLLDGLALSR